MKVVTAALQTHFGQTVTTLATAWKITRLDGEVQGFTDHDVAKTIDGVSYRASSGYFRSAIANSATTAVDNLEVQGFLDDDLISEQELRNHAYDYAEVEIFAYNWADLSMGICRLRYGYFGEVTIRSSGLFVVELRGLLQLLSQTVGETISPDCRADLGDHRCTVKLVPDIRASNRVVVAGERMIVPAIAFRSAIRLPILNAQFDGYQSTTYKSDDVEYTSDIAWTLTNAVVTNYPRLPRTGSHYIRPTGPTGSVRRSINIEDERAGLSDITLRFWVYHFGADWETGGLIELLDTSTGSTVLVSSHEILYSIRPLNQWIQVQQTFVGVDLTNVNYIRITARWRPAVPSTAVASVQVDDFSFAIDAEEITDDFMDFDQDMYASTTALSWSSGSSHIGNVNLLPVFGDAFLATSGSTESTQTVSLTGTGIDFTEVDSGNYVAKMSVYVASFEWGATSRLRLSFRNAGGATISTADSGYADIRPAGEWHIRTFETPVPALTRSIIVRLGGGVTAERTGFTPSKCYDNVSVDLVHVDSDPDDYIQYGGVEYIATAGGLTAATVPTFTHTVGEEVADGSVVWTGVVPQYTFLAEVGSVSSSMVFTLPTIDAEDNLFTWGVLTFLNGDNIGRGIEVMAWDNTTKTITLMLPAYRTIESGTLIRVHSGCDKSVGEGGCLRYSNILNYRGEPDVPGTDQYFKVGGVGA